MALTNTSCVALAALLCSAVFVTYAASEEHKSPYHVWRNECFKEFNIDKTDPAASGVPREKVLGCIMKKNGVITEEGKFSLENAVEVMKIFRIDEEERAKAEEALTGCEEGINSGDRTPEEIAKMVLQCYEEAGVPLPKTGKSKD